LHISKQYTIILEKRVVSIS